MDHFEFSDYGVGWDVRPLTLTADEFLERHGIKPDFIYGFQFLGPLKEKVEQENLDYREVKL